MGYSKIITILGLILNTLGAVILIIPNLKLTRNIKDDQIPFMDKEGNFFQNKHVKVLLINIFGFIFLLLGFILQLLSFFF